VIEAAKDCLPDSNGLKGTNMDTRNEREMTALEVLTAVVMVVAGLIVICTLAYRLVVALIQ